LQGSVHAYEHICRTLDLNARWRTLLPYCEPQLGRRGLYPTLSAADQRRQVEALMWVLNFSDESNDLLAIAEKSGLPLQQLHQAAEAAERQGVLARCDACPAS
jgi:aminopeptidase-like protein